MLKGKFFNIVIINKFRFFVYIIAYSIEPFT